MDHAHFKVQEDELVTMVDLGDLPDFREIPTPPEPLEVERPPVFPSPELLSPTVSDVDETLPGSQHEDGLLLAEPEEAALPDQEVLEDFDEEESGSESAPELADEPEVLIADVKPLPEPVPEPEEVTLPGSEEESTPETAPSPTIAEGEEVSPEPESVTEQLAMAEPAPQTPEPESGSSSTETAGVSDEPEGNPLHEVSAAAEAGSDSRIPASDEPSEDRVTENVKNIKFPPPKKPSREKINRVGLLGMLGKPKGIRPSGKGKTLLSKGSSQPREGFSNTVKRSPRSSPSQSKQKIAMLRERTIFSEQKRLMKRNTVKRRRKSGIKITHGSGRNYSIISSAIEKKRGRLTTVYSGLLQRNPDLQGNLIIEFTISSQGKVIKSQVLTSSLGNPRFEKALVQEIRLWKFPPTKRGETTTVLYPLSFFPNS